MSATAELIYPASYSTHGHQFFKGVPKPIGFDVAARLSSDPRFKISGMTSQAAVDAIALSSRPIGDELMAAIREAADGLDVDEEANFTATGKPNHHALSQALGFPVSPEERDRAMHLKSSPVEATKEDFTGKLETVETAPVAPKKPVIIIPKPKAPAVDPTTEGALTVS